MKNKGLKITAIVLTLLITVISHPFISVSAKEKGTIAPIKLDRYKPITNNSGQLIFDGCGVSYNYVTEDGNFTVNSGLVQSSFPTVFSLYISIQLTEPCSSAIIDITFDAPSSNVIPMNYIVEQGRIVSATWNSLKVQLYNSDRCTLTLVFTLEQLMDYYGYPNPVQAAYNWDDNEWVNYGYRYFDITSIKLSSASQMVGEYTPKLNNILNSVDGIEGLLNSLISNTSDISLLGSINTNISSINSTLNNIYSALLNIDNTIDTISWYSIPITYIGYTTDLSTFDTSSGYHDAGYYWLSNTDFTASRQNSMYKLIIPLGGIETSYDMFEFYQYRNGVLNDIQLDSVLYFANRYYTTIYFVVDETGETYPLSTDPLVIHCSERIYYYQTVGWSLQSLSKDDIEYWTIYAAMKSNIEYSYLNSNLDQVIYIIKNRNNLIKIRIKI